MAEYEIIESEASQSPKSGQLHSNCGHEGRVALSGMSQSPKSGQLHSNQSSHFLR